MHHKARLSLLFILFLFLQNVNGQNSNLIYNQVMERINEFPKTSAEIFHPNTERNIPTNAQSYVSKAEYFELNANFEEQTKSNRPEHLNLEIDFEGTSYHALLYKKEVTSSYYKVIAASGKSTSTNNSIFYRGIIKGMPNSLVSLSLTSKGLHMTIADEKGNFEINKVEDELYAAYRVSDSFHTQETGCATNETYLYKNTKIKTDHNDSRTGECVEVYIESDFDSYTKNGSSIQNTEDWVLAIMNEVGILYENAGIPMFVSTLLVYDIPDPYLAGNNAGQVLGQMGSVIGNNYDGRLAHVFSTRGLGGGVAYVNVLCATNGGGSFGPYAVSGSMNTNIVPFPIYSWNVMVVAHELGHNMGSLHTHNCVWNGNNTQIDDCGNQATSQGDNAVCYDENNPILPDGGSIMSYCHLIGSVGIDFNIGFHPQVADLMFDRYISASCVTGEDCSGGEPPIADFTYEQTELCNPTEVQFTDLSLSNPTGYFWYFPGGTPTTSTEQNPIVSYPEAGLFDVSLTVSNFAGEDELYKFQEIEVVETPEPNFESIIEDGTMKFTNLTTGPVDITFWDFGDGNSSTEVNPCYAYAEDGSYVVKLIVESVCGVFEIEQYIDFFTPPTADFSADETNGCATFTVNFTNQSSTNADYYIWTFEGGNPESSFEINPTVEYNSVGVFNVELISVNNQGQDTLSMVEYITVETEPSANFEYEVDVLELSFSNTSENYDNISWDFGDGNSSTEENPIHTYTEEGVYTVVLEATNSCGAISIQKTINLNTLPTAGVSISETEGCAPFTVDFANNSSSNSDTWLWNFPGGQPTMSTEENPSVVYSEAGTFDVTLIVSNETGSDTLEESTIITVGDVPTADFDISVNDLEVIFTDASTDYNSISWDFGDGNTSTMVNPTHTYNEDGMYEVILTTTNECGSQMTMQTITVSTLPMAGFSSIIDDECVPFTVQFSNNSSSNAEIVEWNFPGGTPTISTEENPIITYSTVGNFDVSLIVSSLAGNDTLTLENHIISYDSPSVNFEYSAISEFEFEFTNLSVNGDTYFWDFGDGNNSAEENPIHTYEQPGTYIVKLTADNGCGEESHEVEIEISDITSTNNLGPINSISVFPNPTNGDFTITFNASESGQVTIELYNMLSQSIYKNNVQFNGGVNKKSIDISGTISGVYFLVMRNHNKRQITKLFVRE